MCRWEGPSGLPALFDQTMMRRLWMGVCALGILVVFFLFYPLYPVLRITTVKMGKVLVCAKMDKDG